MGILRAFFASTSATAFTTEALPSMPILIASAPMSSRVAAICSATIAAGTGWMARTLRVSCTVTAVTAVIA